MTVCLFLFCQHTFQTLGYLRLAMIYSHFNYGFQIIITIGDMAHSNSLVNVLKKTVIGQVQGVGVFASFP